MGPTTERFYVIYTLIVEQRLALLFVFFPYLSGWAMWGPFCCNLGMANVSYTFIPNKISFIEVIQFFWDVTGIVVNLKLYFTSIEGTI